MRIFNPNDIIIIDVRAWYQAATERRELLAMDDRMLRDVGITRIDAERAASQPLPPIVRIAPRPAADSLRVDSARIEAHIACANRLRDEAFRNVIFSAVRWLRDAFRVPRPQPIVRARKLAPIARYRT